MQCSTCGHIFQAGERFCPDCGSPTPPEVLADAPLPMPPTDAAPWRRAPADSLTYVPLTPAPTSTTVSNRAIIGVLVAALAIIAVVALIVAGVGDAGPLAGLFYHPAVDITAPGTTGSTANPAPTAAPQPTAASDATPAPTGACAAALPGSVPPSAGSGFDDVPFPAGATTTGVTLDSNGTGRYTVAHILACAPNSNQEALDQFYTQMMPRHGWGAPDHFKVPYDSGYFVHCTGWQASLCWAKDTAPRYVSLENSVPHSGVMLFQLDLVTPPPAPKCDSSFSDLPYTEFAIIDAGQQIYVALPPLSRISPSSNGASQFIYHSVCSSGTASSVLSYLNYTLPKQHWHLVSTSDGQEWWQNNPYTLAILVNDPTNWLYGINTTILGG